MKKIFSIIALSIIMLCAANTTNAYTNKSDNANATEIVIANATTNSNFNTEIAEPAEPWPEKYGDITIGCLQIFWGNNMIQVDLCGICLLTIDFNI